MSDDLTYSVVLLSASNDRICPSTFAAGPIIDSLGNIAVARAFLSGFPTAATIAADDKFDDQVLVILVKELCGLCSGGVAELSSGLCKELGEDADDVVGE